MKMLFYAIETEYNDDWLRAYRLRKKAQAGDEEARKEFEKMDRSKRRQ